MGKGQVLPSCPSSHTHRSPLQAPRCHINPVWQNCTRHYVQGFPSDKGRNWKTKQFLVYWLKAAQRKQAVEEQKLPGKNHSIWQGGRVPRGPNLVSSQPCTAPKYYIRDNNHLCTSLLWFKITSKPNLAVSQLRSARNRLTRARRNYHQH